jgi:hypothetical protein
MIELARANYLRKPSAAVAATVMSFSILLGSAPVSSADPFDDDGGSYAYDDSGSNDDGGYDDGYAEPADEGNYGDSDSSDYFDTGEFEEPVGDGDDGGGFGGDQPPSDAPEEQPGGGFGGDQPPSGAPEEHPGGGFGGDQPPSGAPEEHPGGGFGGDQHPGEGGGLLQPGELTAPNNDVAVAENTKATQLTSETMTSEVVTSYSQSIQKTFTKSNYSNSSTSLYSPVSQWNSHWTGYDHFYRPVFTNPYSTPMKIMYRADGKQQVLTVPPMEKAVLSTRMKPGVYSFTSMTGPVNGPPTKVSVGSFSGGGYKPRPGQEPPMKPPASVAIKNALVQVKYAQGTSEPFRVSSLTDLGKDSSLKDATRVLLDGEIPAWGEWSTGGKGERMFVISETQLLPGVKPPSQEPLPGYNIKLVSTQKSVESHSWLESNRTLIVVGGAAAGLLALLGIAFTVLRRRRKEPSKADATDATDHADSPTTALVADADGADDGPLN